MDRGGKRNGAKAKSLKNGWIFGIAAAVLAIGLLSSLLHPMPAERKENGGRIGIEVLPEGDLNGETIEVYDHLAGKSIEMPVEDYVYHALAGEMFASYEKEALKAQACAIRTYLAYKMEHGGCAKYGSDICTDYSSCLAYLRDSEMPDRWGGNMDEYEAKLKEAVLETQGEIITYQGEPIDALFHSNAGGETEDVQNVFGGELSYLQGVESYESVDSYKYEETKTFSLDEFYEKISEKIPDIERGDIKVTSSYESGRVKTMQIGSATLSGVEVREALGLNSAHFTVTISEREVSFDVIGYGHGVGLSQAGAQEMAKRGYDYTAICEHYYTGVKIEKRSNS